MRPPSPWAFLLLCLLLSACRSDSRSSAASLQNRLVVLVTVDGLRGDEIERYWPLWRYGLKRLLERGHFFSEATYRHGRPDDAASYATLATGLSPRIHGVVADTIYIQERSRVEEVCGALDGFCGPQALLSPAIADRLKAQSPKSRVLVVAQEERLARLLAGEKADVALWLDKDEFNVDGVTHPPSPELLTSFQRHFETIASAERISRLWELPRMPLPFASQQDLREGEWDAGHGVVFPHRLPGEDLPTLRKLWQRTPDSDRAVGDMATYLIRRLQLGMDADVDYCILSFSAVDYIGHDYGPFSLERVAALMELDRVLGDLLDVVEQQTQGRALVGLTSSHGISPTISEARRQQKTGALVSRDEIVEHIEEALRRRFGPGRYVQALAFPFLHLSSSPEAPAAAVVKAAISALNAHPAVYRAWPVAGLAEETDSVARALYQGGHAGRSGDVVIALRPYQMIQSRVRGELGAETGSPWYYDRHVPVILAGNEVLPGQTNAKVSVIDLVRTLGDGLGLELDAQGGAPLRQALAIRR